MAYEVTRDLPLEAVEIDTPLERVQAARLLGKKLCFVSILRAGNGILDGMLDLVPSARVGHVGLYRDLYMLMPVQYYLKLPDDLPRRVTIVVDPMLATGHSASVAVAPCERPVRANSFTCLIAALEGVRAFRQEHPTCRCSLRRSTVGWTIMVISVQDLAMRAIGSTARSDARPRPASHRCRGRRRSTGRSAGRPARLPGDADLRHAGQPAMRAQARRCDRAAAPAPAAAVPCFGAGNGVVGRQRIVPGGSR